MIKITVKFENKDKDAEDTIISAYFDKFEKIHEWVDKIKVLNEEKTMKQPMGFLTKCRKCGQKNCDGEGNYIEKEKTDVSSDT